MKKLFLLFSVLLASVVANATEARFYFDELKVKKGSEQTVVLKVSNDLEAKGFQLTLTLPDGLTFVSNDVEQLGRLAEAGYMVQASVKSANKVLSIMGVNTGDRMASGDGDMLSFKIKAADDIELGVYQMAMSGLKIVLYDSSNHNLTLTNFNQDIKVYDIFAVTAAPNKEAAGTVTGAGEYENGTNATLTATANTGYQFTKWSDEATDNPYTFAVNADTELTAQFDAINYNLTYELAGGAVATENPASYTIESEAITLNNPTKNGYDFTGWTGTDLTEATTTVTIAKGSTGDRSYTATWTPTVYSIQYNYVGGSAEGNPTSYTIETETFTLVNPTMKGYTFAGWTEIYSNTDKGMTVTIEKGSTGKLLFQARWTLNTYTIDYELNGGTVDGTNPTTFTVNSDDITLINPTKTGYTFAGWTGTGLTAATQTVTIAKGSVDNRSYTATWTINQYTITFDTDGGSTIAPITQDYNSAVTAPAAPTKTGYTFAGWDKEIPSTMPAENITIKALWTINQYTITFDTDGGSTIAPITQDYNTAVTAPAAPTKTGYTFAGWDKEIPATMPAENITIKATWTINQYTITFDTDGGSTIAPITQDYNTAVTAPAAPTKTGYTFAGWDKEIPATMPAENITIKATWTINQYTITFDTDGGSEIPAITQDYNTAVTAPAAPTKKGYTFAGWDKEIPATMPAENITIKALWTLNTYTITYDLDEGAWEGGTNPNPTTYTIESETITLVAPVREGFNFTGWTGTGLTEPTMVVVIEKGSTENRSYKATWQLSTGISAILSNGKKLDVYTIDGRLVKRGMTADEVRQSLRSGMYIINGKKVVLK